jgi:carbon-monoxide dehydrogenase large subunit
MFENVIRETMFDIVARGIGMDPLELRRKNILQDHELPHVGPSGLNIHHVTPAETLERAVAKIGYDQFRKEQEAARQEGRYLGIGISVCVEPTAPAASQLGHEAVTVRIDKSGSVTVLGGTSAQGQSIETTMSQIVAEELGVPIDKVTYIHNDTALAPPGGGSGGSRAGVAGGGACHLAARELREKVLQIAGQVMEAAPEDLEINEGVISVRGTPTMSTTLAQIASISQLAPDRMPPGMEAGLEVHRRYRVEAGTLANATHVCTCEVDINTGIVRMDRYVVSEDCGVMINPLVVEGQVAGGVVQGVGGVLYEHLPYDADGNPLATTYMDYLLPTTTEVPVIEYDHVESPSERVGGYKGVGEGGAVAAPAAIVNAVADALAPLGVKITSQPLDPSRILGLIEAAAHSDA